jgi:signal peptidase I
MSLLQSGGLRVLRNTLLIFTSLHAFVDYIGYPALTEGPSMLPTLAVRGDFVWVSTRHRRGRGIVAGDVVSLRHPWFPEEMASKRVLGMPGDFVCRDTPRPVKQGDEDAGGQMMIQVRGWGNE